MSYGIANEYLAYAIAEVARNEARKLIKNEGAKIISDATEVTDFIGVGGTSTNNENLKFISNILNVLESYNYNMELLKQDRANPDRLTSVIITFAENVKEIIELNRTDDKLSSVIISIYIKDDTMKDTANPFNMPTSIFIKYVFNKYKYKYYQEVFSDPASTQEQKDEAQIKMNEASLENQNLRNAYNISSDNYSYDDLAIFLPNPVGMLEEDFIKYILNKKIYLLSVSGIDIPQETLNKAAEENVYLRSFYLIEEDVYSYEDLKKYLPNPLGMQKEDFLAYYEIKQSNQVKLEEIQRLQSEGADEAEIIAIKKQIYESEQPLRDKYYIIVNVDEEYNVTSDEDMSYYELKEFIETNKIEDNEKLLFKIQVSLNYAMGVLNSVESKLIIEE